MKPPKGRPQKQELGTRFLKEALSQMAVHGVDGARLEDIARACGSSKQAIYRRWGDKHQLMVEAVRFGFRQIPPVYPGVLPLEEALVETLENVSFAFCKTPLGSAYRSLLAQPDLAKHAATIEGEQRTLLRQLFVVSGRAQDMEPLIDQLLGPVYFTCLIKSAPMTKQALQALVRSTLR